VLEILILAAEGLHGEMGTDNSPFWFMYNTVAARETAVARLLA
jgi:hypothetical protein